MQGPIYKFFRLRWTEAYYQLSQTEKDTLIRRITETGNQFGMNRIALCNSSWNDERWVGFGVEVFPDMEAVQKHNAALNDLNWFRYIECETMLGTAFE